MGQYTIDSAYKGMIHYISTIVPNAVTVVEGENYGIRLDDPTGKNPSVAVNVEEISDASLELGSAGTTFVMSCTINAQSRLQRDALKQIVYSGLVYGVIPFYTAYDVTNIPASGAVLIGELEVQNGIRMRDMPDFNDGRDKFFWSSVVFFTVHCLSV